jgi:hypothetical protein
MAAPRNVHRNVTRVTSAVLVALGLAMVVTALVGGGGPLSYGVLIGLLFVVAGAARFWLTVRGPVR